MEYLIPLLLIPAALFSGWLSNKIEARKRKRLSKQIWDFWN